jgi:hypothetical protein
VRGGYSSEGAFVYTRHRTTYSGSKDIDESTDTFDRIDWLGNNITNNNGRGASGDLLTRGFLLHPGTINAHSACKASSPQAPMGAVGNGDHACYFGARFLARHFRLLHRI